MAAADFLPLTACRSIYDRSADSRLTAEPAARFESGFPEDYAGGARGKESGTLLAVIS